MKKTIAKINKTKRWFSEKIKKNDKHLARLKKKRERTQISKIRNEKGEVITTTTKDHKRFLQTIKWQKIDNLG